MNYFVWNLVGPATWPFWLGALAFLFLLFGKTRIALFSLSVGTAAFLALGLSPAPTFLMHQLEERYPRADLELEEVDHILVLGGPEEKGATERSHFLEVNGHGDRIMRGLDLAYRFPRAKLWFVSYAAAADKSDPVEAVADWWTAAGVPEQRVALITDAPNTCQNLTKFAATGSEGSILLVTSAFHMPRAMACARAAGLAPLPYPVDYQGGEDIEWSFNLLKNLQTSDLALHEWLGLAYYEASGRT